MTTDLSDLQPSTTIGVIPPGALRVGGLYLLEQMEADPPLKEWVRLESFHEGWVGGRRLIRGQWDSGEQRWFLDNRSWRAFYPKLPIMVFSKAFELNGKTHSTADAMRAGTKTVTRRLKRPTWCEVGALFGGWDSSLRVGKDERGHTLARGCGTFRVVSVEQQGRWLMRCAHCGAESYRQDGFCPECDRIPEYADTLTPEELEREGCPGMDPDTFWQMLTKMDGVRDGLTFRIAFERI